MDYHRYMSTARTFKQTLREVATVNRASTLIAKRLRVIEDGGHAKRT